MSIASNIKDTLIQLPPQVKLLSVSKTQSVIDINQAYEAGQRLFGENKAREMAVKASELPGDIEWHFIGHLQTNKIRSIISFVHTIQSVESLRLLMAIDTEARRVNRVINCLLQFHIALEDTKFGLNMDEAHQLLNSQEYKAMQNIRITGVMGMATFTDNENTIRGEFRMLRSYFETLRTSYFAGEPSFCEISMGMSGDYLVAIEEGSTMVRIGSLIFGARS
jgi:pyridoxal phosphate enzyme (YggS family)